MSWKKIKTFLILLFLLINLYLIFSTNGSVIKFESVTAIDEETINKTVEILHHNYDISLKADVVPSKINNINIIDVTNYIYEDKLKDNDKYELRISGAEFSANIDTKTYSYNETNAATEISSILNELGIVPDSYKMDFSKSDTGLLCYIDEYVSDVPILNGRIRAEFLPTSISIRGRWYSPHTFDVKAQDNSLRMTDVTGVLIDAASRAQSMGALALTKVVYGYYVSSYDENSVSKTSSAIPCYMIESDNGSKYYYDAYNGNFLKQEDY